ncbi:hypothetical protein B9Z55_008708 [Caenorhabditis nigoni]|nr:hypothetical protein B9Z55_008708 [Caenorhabditis nigoni]
MNGFSSVIVVLNFISISYSTNFDLKSINANKTENQFLDNPATPLDLSFVRNSIGNSPTPEVIENLARLARIVTAITIPIGLSDGSIPEDNLIAEFFNIEPEDVRNMEKFNKQYSELLFIKIKDIKLSNKVNDVMEALVQMFDLRELWKTIDLSNLPNSADYADLESLRSIDVSVIEYLKIADIQNLSRKDSLSDSEVKTLKSSITDLAKAVESLYVNPIKQMETLAKLKPLLSLGKVLDFYTIHGKLNYNQMMPKDKEFLKADFEALKKLKEITLPPSLDVVSRFVSSRFMHHQTNKTYTAGFVNGFKDVDTLKTDRSDAWIQDVVKYDLSTLKEFDRLGIEVVELDGHWRSVSTYSTYKSLKLVSDLCKLIARGSPSHDEIVEVMHGVSLCSTAPIDIPLNEKINKIAGNARLLYKKVSAIHRMQQSMTVVKSQLLDRLSTSASKADLKEMEKLMVKLETDARIVKEGRSFYAYDMYTSDSDKIIDFKEEKPYHIGTFNCIRDLVIEFEKVAAAARTSVIIDQIQKNQTIMDDVKNTYEASSNTVKTLELIKLVFRNIKTYVDPKLTNLTDLQNVSKPFGEAVAALVLSDVVSRRSLDFEEFVNKGFLLENQVDADNGDKFKEEFRAEWGDFQTTAQDINSMFVGITSWIETIKGPNVSLSLEEAGLLYENLTNFVDVDLMTHHRLNAIDRAENEQSTPVDKKLLGELRKALIDLSRLDLKFARFQNSTIQMPETLDLLLDILYVEGIESFTARWRPLKVLDLTFLFGFLIMFYLSLWSVPFSYRNMKKSYKRDIQRRSEKKLDGEEPEDNDFSEFEYDLEEIMVFYDEEMPESVHEDHEQITVRERAKEPEPLEDEAKDFSPDLLELYALYGHDKDAEEPSEPSSTDEYFGTSSREPHSQSWFHLISQDSLGPPPSIISTYSLHD